MGGYSFGTLELIFIVINVLLSLYALNDRVQFNKLSLHVGSILRGREYYRLITSGFIHVSGSHLFFNMLSLVFFAGEVEQSIGSLYFGLIYVIALVGGNILAVFIHRNNADYTAVGASGAVSGIVFCAIALFPGMDLYFLFLENVPIPAWVFGIGFIVYSIYGIRKKNDGIGHEAHLGGAIFGLLGAILLVPAVLQFNALTIGLISIPCLVFTAILLFKPSLLHAVETNTLEYTSYVDVDDTYNEKRAEREVELNRILDKLQKHGPESLTKEEHGFLKEFG